MNDIDNIGGQLGVEQVSNQSSMDNSKQFISSAVPMSERSGSKALQGAAYLNERTKQQDVARNTPSETPSGNDNNKESSNNTSNTIISNSSSSNSTTTINRFDTDTVSKWRSGYINDQHRPGHYSLFS